MKRNLLYNLILVSVLYIPYNLKGQSLSLVKTTKINYPDAVSIDKLGQIYIVDKKGNITRYLTDGSPDLNFSPQQQGHVALIEAWNPLKIFIFYDDLQKYLFLDRFLTNSESFSLAEISGFSGLATLSNDNNLWIIDYVDFGLKKYDLNYAQFILETPFDLLLNPENYEITFFKEYHNLLFISDLNSGIYIFDNFGNYLRKIPVKGVKYFNFSGDSLYYVSDKELIFQHIYNQEKKVLKLPDEPLYGFYLNKSVLVISESDIKTYKIKK